MHSYLDDEFLKLFGLSFLLLFHGVPDSEHHRDFAPAQEMSPQVAHIMSDVPTEPAAPRTSPGDMKMPLPIIAPIVSPQPDKNPMLRRNPIFNFLFFSQKLKISVIFFFSREMFARSKKQIKILFFYKTSKSLLFENQLAAPNLQADLSQYLRE